MAQTTRITMQQIKTRKKKQQNKRISQKEKPAFSCSCRAPVFSCRFFYLVQVLSAVRYYKYQQDTTLVHPLFDSLENPALAATVPGLQFLYKLPGHPLHGGSGAHLSSGHGWKRRDIPDRLFPQ